MSFSRFTRTNPRPLPAYPLYYVSPTQLLSGDRYFLNREEGQVDLVPKQFRDLAEDMDVNKGALEARGWQPRQGINRMMAYACIHALLRSWSRPRDEKLATVGLAILRWFEPIPEKA